MVEASCHLVSSRFILEIPCGRMSCYLSFLKCTPSNALTVKVGGIVEIYVKHGARSLHGLDVYGEGLWLNRLIS